MPQAHDIIRETNEKARALYDNDDFYRASQWEQIGNLAKSLSFRMEDSNWLDTIIRLAESSDWDTERIEYLKSKR